MSADLAATVLALNRRFLLDHPEQAARRLETLPPEEVAATLSALPVRVTLSAWDQLATNIAATVAALLPDRTLDAILEAWNAPRAASLLARLPEDVRDRVLQRAPSALADELNRLMAYPQDSAGALMDTAVSTFRGDTTVRDVWRRLRLTGRRPPRQIFVLDAQNRPVATVHVQDLAMAEGGETLDDLARPVPAAVSEVAPRSEVVDTLEEHRLAEIPVTDIDGRLLGVIRAPTLIEAVKEEVSAEIQTMVGVSKEERALSSSFTAVRRRLPWLQINLLTAFLAAAVVGVFEDTIARFTALAVLLPVVAGQSGNTGAQALAVTMRGLALREIAVRDWLRVLVKETSAGFMNGLAVAATTGAGVYVWSGSIGLLLVIVLSMVLSMIAAGAAGALVPIILVRLRQDPAQASSIILTTVTDVAGFFSFLGIATLLAGLLAT